MLTSGFVAAPMRRVALVLIVLLVLIGSLEGVLRAAPGLIPLPLLEQYAPALRGRITTSLRFPTRNGTRLVPRKDGGSADLMWVYNPGGLITWGMAEAGVKTPVHVDASGFCNPPPGLDPQGNVDIVAVGDSFTFCSAVTPTSTWVAGVGTRLARTTYNLALPARGPYEYLETLRAFGIAKHPRVVVMTIYEGNDLREVVAFQAVQARDRSAERATSCPGGGSICETALRFRGLPVIRSSYAINFLTAETLRLSARAAKDDIDFRYYATLADGSVVALNSRNGDRDEVETARAVAAGRVDVSAFDESIAQFVALSCEHDFVPVLVYFPAAYTAYDAGARFADPAIQATMRAYSHRLRAYFARASASEGIDFLDMTDALAAAVQNATAASPVYFPSNLHLTADGHRIVAEAVASLLQRRQSFAEDGAHRASRCERMGKR